MSEGEGKPPFETFRIEQGRWIALALRFWDPVRAAQIDTGLVVTAHPAGRRQAAARADRSGAGVYVWHDLPGWRELRQRPGASADFIVTVADSAGRFLPVALQLPVPDTAAGFLLSEPPGSESPGSPRRIHLLSAPTRQAPAGMTAVRAHLRDQTTGGPAAHALLEIGDGSRTWYGLADAQGVASVILAYPVLRSPLRSVSAAGTSLQQYTWQLSLRVRRRPGPWLPLPGTALPDLRAVCDQPAAVIWPATGGAAAPVPVWGVPLRLGEAPVVRTEGQSELLVQPAAAPAQL